MAEGRRREAWNHTSQLLAMIYNMHRDPKAKALEPAEFHPYTERRPVPQASLAEFRLFARAIGAVGAEENDDDRCQRNPSG